MPRSLPQISGAPNKLRGTIITILATICCNLQDQ